MPNNILLVPGNNSWTGKGQGAFPVSSVHVATLSGEEERHDGPPGRDPSLAGAPTGAKSGVITPCNGHWHSLWEDTYHKHFEGRLKHDNPPDCGLSIHIARCLCSPQLKLGEPGIRAQFIISALPVPCLCWLHKTMWMKATSKILSSLSAADLKTAPSWESREA